MNEKFFVIFSFIVFVSCSEYKFENCILHTRSETLIIDLSHGLQYDSWIDVGQDLINATYYFSLCPKGKPKCPGNSLFCLKFNNGTILDLGSTYNGTSDVKDGPNVFHFLSLKGKHGSGTVNIQCDGSLVDPVLTYIKLEAFKGGEPYYDYIIQWSSSTNCPIKHFSIQNSCILYTHSGSYDLRPLRGFHKVHVADKNYIINVCEILSPNCSSYACEADNGLDPKPLSPSFQLSYFENRASGLSFNYRTLTGGRIVIDLICSDDEEDYGLNLVSNNEDDLVFSIKTSLVCEFPAFNCLLHTPKKNIAYDLYPLNKMIDNYELKLNNGKRLLLNVCGPLNYIPQVPCADGRNLGCIVDGRNETVTAFKFDNFTVFGPGHIAAIFCNSKNCKKSEFFLNLTLKCSKDVSISPTISDSSANGFNIDWNTYTACPIKYSAGKNCEVDNLYNQSKVNLMPLHNKMTDYFIMNGNESFRINVCGGLKSSCSRNPNAAVCFKNYNGTEIAIGDTSALEPKFVDGQFIFDLEGEPCHKNATKSRVKIIMACEYPNNATSSYFPELFPSAKENECVYFFYWKTPLVCGSSVSSNCTHLNDDVEYNLSSLINLRENYIVNYNDSEIELNICHSLIPGHGIHCYELSGACLKNRSIEAIMSAAYDDHEINKNLGLVNKENDFEIIDNKIRLNYKNGGFCRSSDVETVYSTTIDFICSRTASDTEPTLISIKDCHYNFSWTTPAACPTYKRNATCSINISNKTFELSNFMDKTYTVQMGNASELFKYVITIGICGPVDTIGCSGKSGSCLIEGGIAKNLGNYNSHLKYINGSLRLIYEADDCKSTVIEFNCAESESSGPSLIKRNNCTTIISWSTRLACPNDYELKEMKCCQGIEDLCEKLNQTYALDINQKEKAFINICKPLLPKWGIMCPSGSVSCLANNESLGHFSSEKSLGSFMLPPVLLDDKTAILKYFDGSVCHKDSDTRYSTSITFICDENADIGSPSIANISDDCQYQFKWATSLMCHEKCSLPIGDKKEIDVLQQFRNWDKRIFFKNSLAKSPYILNLCQVSARCGSHVCKLDKTSKWQSFTESSSYQSFKVSDFEARIVYKYLSSNTSKVSESCGAQVDLVCDNNDRGPGRPYLEEERDCFIHVIWKSNLACFPEKSLESSSNIAAWSVFSVAILALVAIVAGVLRFNKQLNLGSCINRTLGYRRSEVDTELEALTIEEKLEEEKLLFLKIR